MSYDACIAAMGAAVKADEARQVDRAVQCYSDAAAQMLKCTATETNRVRKTKLQGHIRQCIERAEELKRENHRSAAVAASTEATKAGDALQANKQHKEAAAKYMSAAETLLKYKKSEPGRSEPASVITVLSQQIQKYVETAELLASVSVATPSHIPTGPITPAEPTQPTQPTQGYTSTVSPSSPQPRHNAKKAASLQNNTLTQEEAQFLRGPASLVYGGRLPEWDDATEGYPSVHTTLVGKTRSGVFVDSSPPSLSEKQVKHSGSWMRPKEFLPEGIAPRVIQDPVDPLDISQSVVGNCSYVCSLTVAANYERRFPKIRLITSSIFPQDAAGRPGISPSGRYAVKLLINGAVRMVTIDDRVVASKGVSWVGGPVGGHAVETVGHSPLCGHCVSGDLWVSLLEKAFLKAFGASYEFGGSNSSTDLYHLCGWIPDSIECQKLNPTEKNAEWKKLYAAHKQGQIIMTMGTGAKADVPEVWEQKLGLVSSHAYSVLDLFEYKNVMLLKMMNPWRQHRWMGRYSHQDNVNWTADLMKALSYDKRQEDNGVFWIDWNDACKFFARVSLSWLPISFPCKLAKHLPWKNEMLENNHFFRCPQYVIRVQRHASTPMPLWVLLVRHLPGNKGGYKSDPFITVHLFNMGKYVNTQTPRIGHSFSIGKENWLCNGVYKNATTAVAKIAIPPGQGPACYTAVVSSLQAVPIPHSLTVYSGTSATVATLPTSPYQHSTSLKGAWTAETAGGRAGSKNWKTNPQFRVTVHERCHVVMTLEVVKDVSVGMSLTRLEPEALSGQGARWKGRIDSIRNRVLKSGTYGPSFAMLDTLNPQNDSESDADALTPQELSPGVYTCIPCTFEPSQILNFKLSIWSSVRSTADSLEVIGKEGEGMVYKKLTGSWAGERTVTFKVFGFRELCCRMVAQGDGGIVTARLTVNGTAASAQGISEYLFPLTTVHTSLKDPAIVQCTVHGNQPASFVLHCHTNSPMSVM